MRNGVGARRKVKSRPKDSRGSLITTIQEDEKMLTKTEELKPLKTGLQFASEVVIPGGSNLVSGEFSQGALHFGLSILAGALFGGPGILLVAANSFAKATTGHHIYESFNLGGRPTTEMPTT